MIKLTANLKHYRTVCTLLSSCSIMFAIAACGKLKEEASNQRDYTKPGSSNADQTVADTLLLVSGSFKDGQATSLRLHHLNARIQPGSWQASSDSSDKPDSEIKLIILDPSGQVVFEQAQEGKFPELTKEWDIRIDKAEGFYTAQMQVRPLGDAILPPMNSWKARFELDTTQPSLAFEAKASAMNDDGRRQLDIKATVRNETAVSCAEASVETTKMTSPIGVQLLEDKSGGEDRTVKLNSASLALQDFNPSNTLVRMICSDAAGNKTELLQPVTLAGVRDFSLQARIDAQTAQQVGAGAQDKLFSFLQPGLAKLKLQLLDPSNGKAHTSKVIDAEKATLRIFITEKAPSSAKDLLDTKAPLWTQPYSPELNLPIPPSYLGAHTIFVSLLRHDQASNSDLLLSTLALDLYVDNSAPQVSWQQTASFKAPTLGNPLTLSFKRDLEGAPLAGPMLVEYSVNGTTWTALPVTETALSGNSNLFSLKFVYPLSAESAFRLRVTAKDIAGNSQQSDISPSVIGKAGLNLATSENQRAACLDKNSQPGSQLKVFLASSQSCKKLDLAGQLSPDSYVSLVFLNAGQVAPSFYSTPSQTIREGFAYKVLADGVQVAAGRYDPPELFRLGKKDVRLLQFVVNESWLQAQRIEIKFDAEASDAYSTTNSCYTVATPYPTVIIQDRSKGLSL
ncbi:MAG: hypothetical protein NTX25_11245, partial [Proteobacteria bacterium]|nr:hypothetical protein [Pseudomonadota bacterium]